ncbi:MAG TPA: hypothetical protein P5204_08555 [Kiritimatiellia bacterium]|nr:hypothetical protein [Kiritimatiellia bacterium]
MKKIPRLFVLLAVLAGGFAAPVSAALTDPAQIQTEAYVNLVQADQSLDAGRLDEALAQYKAARDYYLQLAKDFPGWEPKIIQYRKTYCDNQIIDVERRLAGGGAEELPELEAPPPAVAAAMEPEEEEAEPAPSQSVELDYLKSRVARLENELAALDTDNLRLREELKSASKAKADLDALRADLDRKNERIQALEKELEAKQQLDQALNDMEASANDLRAENARLKDELKKLDAELDDAEVRADQAELKAKQAEDKLKDAEKAAQKAEKEIEKAEKEAQRARDQQAEAEARLADAKKKTDTEKPKAEAEKAKAEAPAEKKVEAAKTEPPREAAASLVAATVPPRAVPKGMSAADFVRQLLQEGENDAALATVQEARKTRPTDMNLVLIESIALIRLQQYREAAAMLVDLAKNNPRNAEIHATLGAAMMGAGFYEEARETLLMAVKFDRNLPECHFNLAQLYALVDPKDLKQARKHYKQALELGIPPDAQLDKILK